MLRVSQQTTTIWLQVELLFLDIICGSAWVSRSETMAELNDLTVLCGNVYLTC